MFVSVSLVSVTSWTDAVIALADLLQSDKPNTTEVVLLPTVYDYVLVHDIEVGIYTVII